MWLTPSDSNFFARLNGDASVNLQRSLVAAFFETNLRAKLPFASLQNKDISHLITLILSLAVQSDQAQSYVDAIRALHEAQQETLMRAIETVCLVVSSLQHFLAAG